MFALRMLEREAIGLDYILHRIFITINIALLKTYLRDNDQMFVLILGPPSMGKSHLMKEACHLKIDKTTEVITVRLFG